ncbi:hypothetical protein HY448_02130 [Candidatus Pacearchaeota archaeon]|nr:hypothetical protein [Candidatus Pacearchaeota archaeon]
MIEDLREFLSTDARKQVFWSYALGKKAQSDILEGLKDKMSLSTVDRITHTLRYIKSLKKEEAKDNKQYYSVDWEMWIMETLQQFHLRNVDKQLVKEIVDFVRKPEVISLSFYLSHPSFLKFFLEKDILFKEFFKKIGNEKQLSPEFFMNYFLKKGPNPADYPSSLILDASPLKNIFSHFFKDSGPDGNVGDELSQIIHRIYIENKGAGLIHPDQIQKNIENIEKERNNIIPKIQKEFVKVMTEEIKKDDENED